VKKIANIISEKELSNHKKLDWMNYAVTVPNLYLPTLIIGWENFKYKFPNFRHDILKKKIFNEIPLFWEFSIEEKITDHFTGIENFVKNAPRMYVEQFKYKSIDPISDNIDTVEQLWNAIPDGNLSDLRYYQYKDEIIYILNKTRGEIYGIYLTAFKYFGLDNKIIADFFSNKIIAKTIDSDASIYQSYYRQFPDFDQLKRAMVLFLV
jgi:hypothetical protein